jgi:glyoxylase-like metal-dependent hydrolase (beta-lactamase superfamily II)
MHVKRIVVGPLASNCYLVRCSDNGEALVIDPGAEPEVILKQLEMEGLTLRYIINTHGHGDHIGANAALKELTGAAILIHAGDAPMLTSAVKNLSAWLDGGIVSPPADRTLADGDELRCGDIVFKVLATPGHTPGGISILGPGVVFTGDTLFQGSIGRTDFPGGSFTVLLKSIREKLLILPDETLVYPGHGPATSIGREKMENPFLQ